MGQPIRETVKGSYQFSGYLEEAARANERVLNASLKDSNVSRRASLWRSGADRELAVFGKSLAELHGGTDHKSIQSVIRSMRFASWYVNFLVTRSVVSQIDPKAAKLPALSWFDRPVDERTLGSADTFIVYHPRLEKIAESAVEAANPNTDSLRHDCRVAASYMLRTAELQVSDVIEAELTLHETAIENYGEVLIYMD